MASLERQSEVVDGHLRTAPLESSLPWRQASFAVLGLEATGQDQRSDQLVSVACVPVEGGNVLQKRGLQPASLSVTLPVEEEHHRTAR
jgi:DNA polymerase III epsilon subunit-like protein